MIKHLIKFEGKQIALDRAEIAQLHSAIEPYLVGILNAIPDHELPRFVQQYVDDLYSKRKMVKERKNIPLKVQGPQKPPEEIKTPEVNHADNIVSLGDFRERKRKINE